jgi:hypothetical protein
VLCIVLFEYFEEQSGILESLIMPEDNSINLIYQLNLPVYLLYFVSPGNHKSNLFTSNFFSCISFFFLNGCLKYIMNS